MFESKTVISSNSLVLTYLLGAQKTCPNDFCLKNKKPIFRKNYTNSGDNKNTYHVYRCQKGNSETKKGRHIGTSIYLRFQYVSHSEDRFVSFKTELYYDYSFIL